MKWLVVAIILGFAATFASLEALAQGWLSLPPHMYPDPNNAWLYALGFLGIVVLRRTRSGPMH